MNQPKNKENYPPFPWYDSRWLQAYVEAKTIIRRVRPEAIVEFESAMKTLQAPSTFQVRHLKDVLDEPVIKRIKQIIANLDQKELEQHEFFSFGRFILRNHPEFTAIQSSLTDMVSEIVKEEVVPSYNFLSLYNNLGVCKAHMDAPSAKWTLDICIDQSGSWPIHFSQLVPWPEKFKQTQQDWHAQLVNYPDLRFKSFSLEENEAIVFCGSNQWHYRDRIARQRKTNFCHLVFFHYVPVACLPFLNPNTWAEYFSIAELNEIKFLEQGLEEEKIRIK